MAVDLLELNVFFKLCAVVEGHSFGIKFGGGVINVAVCSTEGPLVRDGDEGAVGIAKVCESKEEVRSEVQRVILEAGLSGGGGQGLLPSEVEAGGGLARLAGEPISDAEGGVTPTVKGGAVYVGVGQALVLLLLPVEGRQEATDPAALPAEVVSSPVLS